MNACSSTHFLPIKVVEFRFILFIDPHNRILVCSEKLPLKRFAQVVGQHFLDGAIRDGGYSLITYLDCHVEISDIDVFCLLST